MELEQVTVTGLDDVCTVYSRGGEVSKMENRLSYGLLLCYEGRITYCHGNRRLVSEPGVALLAPKGADYILQRQETGRFPVVNFQTAEALTETFCRFSLQRPERCLELYERARERFVAGRRLAALSAVYRLLAEVNGEPAARLLDGSPLQAALAYMEEHIADPELNNTRLAEQMHISEVYLRKLFLQHLEMTPRQYLLKQRMKLAQQLLEENRLTVTQVAAACGYKEVYHFSRSFHQKIGMTPGAYRQSRRELL